MTYKYESTFCRYLSLIKEYNRAKHATQALEVGIKPLGHLLIPSDHDESSIGRQEDHVRKIRLSVLPNIYRNILASTMQAQARTIQAQAQAQQEMQRKHAEEIETLRAERGRTERSAQHSVSPAERGNNQQNENDGSHNRQSSQHTNLNGRGRREPSPLQTVWPANLLPFTATIMQTPMPEKNPPALEKYDGSTDPDNHLRIFINAMTFYTDNDPVICKAFSLSLKDEALEWYNTLPPS
ncbi:hypothetical protein V8G54_036126 [Vigna mungo]|uniref:Retrotransposon gag domain-containing protein n=1 Tax=Vigna mungo TaxID=3915 RepID=A0AAQ3RFA9_VIGMU